MPSINPQPDDELLNRILGIERQLREVSTVRSRPSHNAKVVRSTSIGVSAATPTVLNFGTILYENPVGTFDLSTDLYSVPSDGIYEVIVNLRCSVGSSADVWIGLGTSLGTARQGDILRTTISTTNRNILMTTITPMRVSDDPWMVWVESSVALTVETDTCLTLQRLADIPENSLV